MKVGNIRSLLAGAACAALMLAPAVAATTENGAAAPGRNLTQEQQQAGPIPLPSFAPLAQHILPAVVNISVQLNQQGALQDQMSDEDQGNGDNSGNGGGLPQFGGTPFDQFLHRFFENPFAQPRPGQQVMALGSGFVIDPRGYIVTNNHVVANAE
jgi:serine protease Do